MTLDPYARPSSDAEMFDQYYGEVVRLVYKLGVQGQDAADMASDILARFYERGVREMYDPSKKFRHEGELSPASFRTFLYSVVRTYLRGKLERYDAHNDRNRLLCDKPLWKSGYRDGDVMPWVEVFGPNEAEDTTVEAVEMVRSIRAYLVTVPRRSSQDICDLPRLFDLVVEQTWGTGRIRIKEMQEEFGVSDSAIHSWIRRLREQVAIALEGLGYEKGLGYWDGLGYEKTARGWAPT